MMLNKFLNEYENELREILDALRDCYFDELDDCTFDESVVIPFKDSYKKPFKAANGATKGVLIFPNFGFVIKIPFVYCDGDELCGAQDGVNAWDYCSQEVCRYEMAEEEGFGDIFLETDLLGEVNNHPIYIQPYADILGGMDSDNYNSNHCSSTDVDRTLVKEIAFTADFENFQCILAFGQNDAAANITVSNITVYDIKPLCKSILNEGFIRVPTSDLFNDHPMPPS